MTWVLVRRSKLKHPKSGKPIESTTYHMRINETLGFPVGSTKVSEARPFITKALAETYAKNKGLTGYGYKAERLPETPYDREIEA